jgi:uncharacterized protein DUF6159
MHGKGLREALMGKIRNSWEISKQCWRVLMLDRELLVFPIMSAGAMVLVIASFFIPLWESGVFQQASEHHRHVSITQDPVLFAVYFAFYLVSYFVIIYFNAALISAAMIRLRGGDPTIGDGLRAANRCLPAILGWTLLSAVIGMIIQAIEERVGILGKLVVGFIGLAWAVASYFVIPTIVTENVGPVEALKRSAAIIKKTWGETLTVQVGLSLLAFGAGLLAMVVMVGGGALMPLSPILGGSVMALGLIAFFAAILVTATLQAILTAALYLYAADGKVPGNFDNALLKNAFAPKS